MSVNAKMTAIADAIRDKTGGTEPLGLDAMAAEIANMAVTAKLIGLSIHRPPDQTQYDDLTSFDPAGMEVHASYDDGHFLDVTAHATYTPNRPLTVGDTSITVSYIEDGINMTATQPITVRYLTGIEVTTPPNKVNYIVGDLFDPTGMAVTGSFSIGAPAIVTGWDYEPKTPLGGGGGAPLLDPVFEHNSWAAIAQACADGTVPASWNTDSEKVFVMNGVAYTWQILGKNHDNLHPDDPRYGDPTYNGGSNKAALSLIMKECHTETHRMHNSTTNNWQNSDMRNVMLPARLAELPAAQRDIIRTVGKPTAQSGTNATIITTANKLWLPSQVEVFGANDNSHPGEGTQYAFYAAGNSKIKKRNGTENGWSLRSPYKNYSEYVGVNSAGSANMNAANAYVGLVICCCL